MAPGIDRIDRAAEGRADQVPEQGAPHAAGPLAGTDHRHAAGPEQGPERLPLAAQDVVGGVGASALARGAARWVGHGAGSWEHG